MSCNRGKNVCDIMELGHIGPLRRRHHDNGKTKGARRCNLGIGRLSAAVLGHENVDGVLPHQGNFIVDGKDTTRQQEVVVGRQVHGWRRIDGADQVMMGDAVAKITDPQPTNRQEDAPGRLTQRGEGGCIVGDLNPVVTCDRTPGRTREGDQWDAGHRARNRGILRNAGGEGMRGIDKQVDLLVDDVAGKSFCTAKAANTDGNWLRFQVVGPARIGQDGIDLRALGQGDRQAARFRCSTEDQDTHGHFPLTSNFRGSAA